MIKKAECSSDPREGTEEQRLRLPDGLVVGKEG